MLKVYFRVKVTEMFRPMKIQKKDRRAVAYRLDYLPKRKEKSFSVMNWQYYKYHIESMQQRVLGGERVSIDAKGWSNIREGWLISGGGGGRLGGGDPRPKWHAHSRY